MQGIGEGPAGILAGTPDGSLGMWKSLNNPEQAQQHYDYLRSHVVQPPAPIVQPPPPAPVLAPVQAAHLQGPFMWPLDQLPFDLNHQVTCLAATDEVVVNGFTNTKIRIARMKEQELPGAGSEEEEEEQL